ncbi:LysR family transcriptional regulator [Pseudonocardia sp. CA-107938]|uniref:LysR family transcriptional regulator n=1 Tax=Pseudonocardia sp. CA-107938 TaxID=3240021 RepID=UPI003D8C8AD0
MIEFLDLRILESVAEHGSFSRAAAALGYTQPAISYRIARLEKELGGTALIDRGRRGRLQLTAAGQVALRYANQVSADMAGLRREVCAAAGSVRMVAFPTAAATLVPRAVAAFRQQHPDVRIQLSEAEPQAAIPHLARGEVDIAVGYTYPAVGEPGDGRMRTEELFRDEMALALPLDHPLATRSAVHVADLRDEQWILPHECPCRRAIAATCRAAGFTPDVTSETSDYLAMQGLVACGVGVALLPRLVAAVAVHPGIVLRPLAEEYLTRVVTVATRPTGHRTPACTAMLDAIKDAAAAVYRESSARTGAAVPGR